MPFLILIIFSVLVVGTSIENSKKIKTEKEITKIETIKIVPKKPNPLKVKIEPKKIESVQKDIKPEPKDLKPKEPEVTKEELKPEVEKLEPVKNEINVQPKEPIPVIQSLRPETLTEELKKTDVINEPKNNWLKITLYIIGSILFFLLGRNLYSRFKKNLPTNAQNNFQRKEFKEVVESDSSEQQTENEQVQSDSSEQQTENEDETNNK